jgi:hypothetical protein
MGNYQRRTQKGMGRTEKITHTGITKNPRLLKTCNIAPERIDMIEFFFISLQNGIAIKWLTVQSNSFFANLLIKFK